MQHVCKEITYLTSSLERNTVFEILVLQESSLLVTGVWHRFGVWGGEM